MGCEFALPESLIRASDSPTFILLLRIIFFVTLSQKYLCIFAYLLTKKTDVVNTKRLETYCWRSYLDFTNPKVLKMWRTNRKDHDVVRAITRPFYELVHSFSIPSGFITEQALLNKRNDIQTVICKDHCYSPQFVYQMLMDNHEQYADDYDKYREMFKRLCTTIEVLPDENRMLSLLTSNRNGKYTVHVPTDRKYQHLGIQLVKRNRGRGWYKLPIERVSNYIETPAELLEYESHFLER